MGDSVESPALPPASRAQSLFLYIDPGACAPGFMLPPASRARHSDILRLNRREFFGHADEIGEGIGAHFFHDLAAVEFDGDFARA